MNIISLRKKAILWRCYLIGLGIREASRAAMVHTSTVTTHFKNWKKLGIKKYSDRKE